MKFYKQKNPKSSLIAEINDTYFDLTAARSRVKELKELFRASELSGVRLSDLTEQIIDEEGTPSVNLHPEQLEIPFSPDEVWAAGVTYKISEKARQRESEMSEIYLDIYESKRPELFLKATPSRVVGPNDPIGVREDSEWNVPEPELGLVLYKDELIGYTVGNDVSSRSIEGRNPLYLPQAKVYNRSCAIGPSLLHSDRLEPYDFEISMEILRDGTSVYEGLTSTNQLNRSFDELIEYMSKSNILNDVTVLLTGTSLVPPDEFDLKEGDVVNITIEGIGTLTNPVVSV